MIVYHTHLLISDTDVEEADGTLNVWMVLGPVASVCVLAAVIGGVVTLARHIRWARCMMSTVCFDYFVRLIIDYMCMFVHSLFSVSMFVSSYFLFVFMDTDLNCYQVYIFMQVTF